MNNYVKKVFVGMSASLLVLTISACGGGDDVPALAPNTLTVKQLPESETVQTAFDAFNDFDFTDGNETALIEDLKYTLNNPVNGEISPDIATSIALIELFELSSDPVISKYFTISIKDYPTLVSNLTEYSDTNDVNTLLDEDMTNALSSFDLAALLANGFSYDLPEPSHKAAEKFKNLSDTLALSFPDESYVFRYWANDDFDGYVAKYLRVGLLTSASMLEMISAYSYGAPEDYLDDNNKTRVLYDPVGVLNEQKIFVFDENNATSVARLANAKVLLIEALELSKEIDIAKLPESEIDYYSSLREIEAILDNLLAQDGEETPYKYDLHSIYGNMYINFQAFFSANTAIDIKDFGENAFIYDCGMTASYDLLLSELNASQPVCDNGLPAYVLLDTLVAKGMEDNNTNFDELIINIGYDVFSVDIPTPTLMNKLFEIINDEVK